VGLSRWVFSFMADYETEKFMKRMAGRTDVEDALDRLDLLTKEENLMTAARNLEVTHQVNVNVMATQEVIHDVYGNVKETKELTRDVHNDIKVTRHGARYSFEIFIHFTDPCLAFAETAIDEQQRSFDHRGFIADCHR